MSPEWWEDYFAGNGGSFADAQHLAAEFTARFQKNRIPLPSVWLPIAHLLQPLPMILALIMSLAEN